MAGQHIDNQKVAIKAENSEFATETLPRDKYAILREGIVNIFRRYQKNY